MWKRRWKWTNRRNVLVFRPRGERDRPRNLLELFDMPTHVLEMLVELHAAGWMHRNVRWISVHVGIDTKVSWLVTEFNHAVLNPQHNPIDRQLVWKDDPPEMFGTKGEHMTAVDLWYTGQLIRSNCVAWDANHERESFADGLLAEDPSDRPSAHGASERLLKLKQRLQKRNRKRRSSI